MRSFLPKILTFLLFFFLAIIFVITAPNAKAATATHLVISEIQLAGSVAADDFIEIYNPTSSSISLNGYRLGKRSNTGATDSGIIVFKPTDSISSHGYFLWCNNTNLSSSLNCDASSAATIANNNSIGLRNGPANTGTVVDAVTFGTVTNALGEGTPISPALTSSNSAERKANSNSDSPKMALGGTDESLGNGEDTDNNANDFVLRNTPQPQNSFSSFEPVPNATPTSSPTNTPTPTATSTPTSTLTPTETPTVTETPSPTLTETPSPTPTSTPTSTPNPTETATPTPTSTPITTPTSAPTVTPIPTITSTPTSTLTPTQITSTPTLTPSPTIQSTPILTPTLTLTPTLSPTPTSFPFPNIPQFQLSCTTKMLNFNVLSIHIQIPLISCKLIKL